MLDFIRIATAVPAVRVGDTVKNTADICAFMEKADAQNVDVLLFPELALTGYSCGDLFFQDTLWNGVKKGLADILTYSEKHPNLTAVIGLPLRAEGTLYNCAAVICAGELCGLVPKTHLAVSGEANEDRWFTGGEEREGFCVHTSNLGLEGDYYIPVEKQMLYEVGGAKIGIELCQDLMVPLPPSNLLALDGAEVILNLSASHELVGKRAYRRDLIKHQSGNLTCIYAYCSAGCTESTTDLVFSGHSIIAENGAIIKENQNALECDYLLVADCDLGRIRADRLKNKSFHNTALLHKAILTTVETTCHTNALRSDGSLYPLQKLPFIPSEKQQRIAHCLEIFNIQAEALKQRLSILGTNAVLGISGGLDSTLALLVAVEAMRRLGRPASDVYGVTMPCFGTSDRTYNNAWELMRKLGISAKEISIKDAVTQHFADIGHDISVHNGTYENSQARERTQILMDYASVVGGIVVGTGDLSELALGWCTYNGDHMSMYGVNGTVPKTLIRWIIEAVSDMPAFRDAKAVLADILDTPISPELLPPDAEGKISQQTEDLVGPYALHDFFLYHMIRWGFTPTKIYTLACRAFANDFDSETVKKWLKNFYRRFFTQQFKRNCQPDGVKVGSVSLGVRGDWHMPSDATYRIWMEETENL